LRKAEERLPAARSEITLPLRLYEHPLSPYVRKVKIVLYEKGVPFERVLVTPMFMKADDPIYGEFSGASPRLEVPCLIDGAFRCFDSTIIVDYIDERWPDRPMLPESPEERARARMVEEVCDSELDAINWGMMEIRIFRRAEGDRADQLIALSGDQLGRVWDRLERELDLRPWFSGSRFGRADAALVVHVSAAGFFGHTLHDRHPRLKGWNDRCLALPSVQRDMADLAEFMSTDKTGRALRGGGWTRQYRDHRLEWMMKIGASDIVQSGLEKGTIRFAQGS
jgi:glutathione S-transferase/RNA polymerase-associated protein